MHQCWEFGSRMCVCVTSNRCKTPLLFFLLSSPFLITQGATAPFISPWPTKLLMFGEDMQFDQLHEPAFFWHSKGPSSEPQTQWFYFFTVATICIFAEKYYKGIYFRSNCLVWFLWWLRQGAVGPIEATLFGWLSTDLTSELTHFNLVIRLSKAKQLALLLCAFCEVPRIRLSLEILWTCFSTAWSRAEHSETSFFDYCSPSLWHSWEQARQVHACRFGDSFFSWLSGEVKHIVHLIRWNLNSCYMPSGLTWLPSRQGNNARPLGI